MRDLTNEEIKSVFIENGFVPKRGKVDLETNVYEAARALLALADTPLPDELKMIPEVDFDFFKPITPKPQHSFSNYPQKVAESWWPILMDQFNDMEPISVSTVTHCFDKKFKLGDVVYSVVYEYGNLDPIDITLTTEYDQ